MTKLQQFCYNNLIVAEQTHPENIENRKHFQKLQKEVISAYAKAGMAGQKAMVMAGFEIIFYIGDRDRRTNELRQLSEDGVVGTIAPEKVPDLIEIGQKVLRAKG